jgi:mono/diheme cytochrome c family protein
MNQFLSSFVLVTGLAAAGVHAQAPAPGGNAENGKAVFIKAKCFSCHGTVGRADPEPPCAKSRGIRCVSHIRPAGQSELAHDEP